MVRGQGYVLCLDDFHHGGRRPIADQFIERLQPTLEAGQVRVVLVTQRRPSFVLESDVMPLGGLTPADMRLLLGRRGFDLSDSVVADLYACTDGNAAVGDAGDGHPAPNEGPSARGQPPVRKRANRAVSGKTSG